MGIDRESVTEKARPVKAAVPPSFSAPIVPAIFLLDSARLGGNRLSREVLPAPIPLFSDGARLLRPPDFPSPPLLLQQGDGLSKEGKSDNLLDKYKLSVYNRKKSKEKEGTHMEKIAATSQYLHIARDLAARIAKGEFPEGGKLFGRSMLASEYGVSPETIRRALRLLADMKVLEIKAQSGAVVLSTDNARRYLVNFEESASPQSLLQQFAELLDRYDELHQQLTQFTRALLKNRPHVVEGEPLPNYEITVPKGSPVIGKSLGQLKYWQSTGGTIVAIRRGANIILSPGPYAELYDGDVIILVGPPAAAEASARFVAAERKSTAPGGAYHI